MNEMTTIGLKHAEIPPLPEHYEAQAKSFFSDYVHRAHELDVTKQRLDEATLRIAELETEAEGLRSHIATLESRMTTCVLERDRAVTSMAKRETVLLSVFSLLEQECRDLNEAPAS